MSNGSVESGPSSGPQIPPLPERFARSVSGNWGSGISPGTKRGLWWFWLDGAFALGGDSIVTTFLALYIASLGATGGQIGAMSSLGSLAAAMVLLPGAWIVERFGRRGRFSLIVGILTRLILLLLALLPLWFNGSGLIALAIGLVVLRETLGNLGLPSWVSLTADIVPAPNRGRFFSSRNFGNALAGMLTVYLAGLLITGTDGSSGYPLALLLAFAFGMGSSFCFSRITDPHPAPPADIEPLQITSFIRHAARNPSFLSFCLVSALFNFSLNIASPFFNLHLVQSLNAAPAEVAVLAVSTSVATLFGLRFFGNQTDRHGSRRVALVTSLIIPVIPLGWVFFNSTWQVLPANLLAGFIWSGYNLAIFNLLLEYTPDSGRARYTAIYQVLIMLAMAGGAAFGGWTATVYSFRINFLFSAIGRMAAALLFLFLIPQSGKPNAPSFPEQTPPAPDLL